MPKKGITMNIIQNKKRSRIAAQGLFVALSLAIVGFIDARALNHAPMGFTYEQPLFINTDKAPCWSFNSIAFVNDNNKQTFIIKSYCNSEHAIHEALGASVGTSVGIRINKVKIIPPHINCVGKQGDCAATIHTCVPGIEVCNIDTMRNAFDVYGGLSCVAHLKSLVDYDDLCSIVALDIFLDNFDRHNGNLFFDDKTGLFYAIDMDRIFWPALAFPTGIEPYDAMWNTYGFTESISVKAYNFLSTLKPATLSSQEIVALNHVRDWLNKLIVCYPCSKLYNLWMNLAQQAVYEYSAVKKGYIESLIDYNCSQAQRVVVELDRLVLA